ncbi:putative odorant-binding protein A10 [Condylostylus longicornis]|uniref:putative odorant-binding protein A10 n=1 Tax=Condylostylus longicornis TaxID=2530218 RepID=UPI00244E0B24|nr:putative odorant-binding protein A10 [Condylostylus longicornis]
MVLNSVNVIDLDVKIKIDKIERFQMSFFIFLLIIFFIGNSISIPVISKEIYDTKYDNIDIDEILNNERLLKNYIKCLENEGPCTADGKMLKETLPDAVSTNCSKCSEKQKYGADKITHFLIDNRLQDWIHLEKIFDPEGSYRRNYLELKNLETTTEDQNKGKLVQIDKMKE